MPSFVCAVSLVLSCRFEDTKKFAQANKQGKGETSFSPKVPTRNIGTSSVLVEPKMPYCSTTKLTIHVSCIG
jgi:hypothetical protein